MKLDSINKKKYFPKSNKSLFAPKKQLPIPNDGEVLKFFVLANAMKLPGQIAVAIFKNGFRMSGNHLIPEILTENTFCFDSIDKTSKHECKCGKVGCKYGQFLKQAIKNFRKEYLIATL